MSDTQSARNLLRDYGLRPQKSLGQNFLVDEEYLQCIVQAGRVGPDDDVLEIGAGIGSLTRHLALAARHVCAVEIDGQLLPILENQLAGYPNVALIEGDIMQLDMRDLVSSQGYKVVANIPYYLTSNLIRHLLESPLKPSLLALTIQKEVAERVCAHPGQMSLLSLSVQVYGKPQIALSIPAAAFYPVPKVDSATLVVEIYDKPLVPYANLDAFFRLIKAAFMQKRKMLHNALAGGPDLDAQQTQSLLQHAGIDPGRRAQTLSIEEWGVLTETFLDR